MNWLTVQLREVVEILANALQTVAASAPDATLEIEHARQERDQADRDERDLDVGRQSFQHMHAATIVHARHR
jgi:hypothetical protein